MSKILTNFGDAAFLLPISAAIFAFLWATRSRHAASWWLTAVLICTGATALLKIYFYGCANPSDPLSPSGHVSFAALVYGGVALILAGSHRAPAIRWGGLLGASVVTALIAVTRVRLHAHSPLDVAIGLAIGLAALALFGWGCLRDARAAPPTRPLVLIFVAMLAVFYGTGLHAEQILHRVGREMTAHAFCR